MNPIKSTLLASDPECIDIVEKYVKFLPGRLIELKLMVAENNIEEFKRLLHDLKGVSGGMGYAQISLLCQNIETNLAAGKMTLVNEGLNEMAVFKDQIVLGFNSLA